MVHKIVIPRVGVNVTEFRLIEWKGKEGDWIEKESIVLLIETEKTKWEVEAGISGYLHILVEAENKAEVGKVVGSLAETKEELEEVQKASPKEAVSERVVEEESALEESSQADVKSQGTKRKKGKENITVNVTTIIPENLDKTASAEKNQLTNKSEREA